MAGEHVMGSAPAPDVLVRRYVVSFMDVQARSWKSRLTYRSKRSNMSLKVSGKENEAEKQECCRFWGSRSKRTKTNDPSLHGHG